MRATYMKIPGRHGQPSTAQAHCWIDADRELCFVGLGITEFDDCSACVGTLAEPLEQSLVGVDAHWWHPGAQFGGHRDV